MHGVALKGIAVLKECLEPIKDPKTVDLLLVNYFENAMKFCVSTKDQTAVINKFNEHFEDWKMDSKGSLASSAQEHSEPFDILKLLFIISLVKSFKIMKIKLILLTLYVMQVIFSFFQKRDRQVGSFFINMPLFENIIITFDHKN